MKKLPNKSKKIESFLKSNPVLGYDYETEWDDTQALHVVYLEAPYLFDGDRQLNVGDVKDFMTNCQYIDKIETKKEWEEITGSEYPASRLDPSEYSPELNR
tara:strand:+ start:83 stop:385 length:303 start_codon:yes stop_codon:yes gene_type:complete